MVDKWVRPIKTASSLNWYPYLDENGKIKNIGDTVVDIELANTLEKIANDPGKDTFYTGDLSHDIAADLLEMGSLLRSLNSCP